MRHGLAPKFPSVCIPALRVLKSKILTQRRTLVFAAEQAAILEDRHHEIDEVVQGAGEVGSRHVEPVAGPALDQWTSVSATCSALPTSER